jgi:hypothetical protein
MIEVVGDSPKDSWWKTNDLSYDDFKVDNNAKVQMEEVKTKE